MSKQGPYTGVTVKELIHDAEEARKSGKFTWLQEYCPTCHAITFVSEPEGYMYCQSCGRKRSQYAKTNHIVDADKMIVDREEELARIFNRTDDKEELYKQVLELLRKIK